MGENLSQAWMEMAKYCNNVTQETGLDQALQQAMVRGKKRGPKIQDFVVHPEWPWQAKVGKERRSLVHDDGREVFKKMIMKILSEHPESIVLQHPGEVTEKAFLHPRTVFTATGTEVNNATVGMIDAKQAERLLDMCDGVHPHDVLMVHGAAMNHCPTAAAVQLFALAQWQVFLPPCTSRQPQTHAPRRHFTTAMLVLSQLQLTRGKIEFGILHDTFGDKKIDPFSAQMVGNQTVMLPD